MKKYENIVLVGPMGAGKTSIGKHLAREIGWDFYDSDHIIEERAGADILWIYDLEGEAGFRTREEKIITELVQKNNIVLATGGSSVISAKNQAVIALNSFVIYLRIPLDHQVVRTSYSKKRPLSSEDEARRSSLLQLQEECEPLYEKLADLIYDTDGKSVRIGTVVTGLIRLIQQQGKILNHRI